MLNDKAAVRNLKLILYLLTAKYVMNLATNGLFHIKMKILKNKKIKVSILPRFNSKIITQESTLMNGRRNAYCEIKLHFLRSLSSNCIT